MLHSPLSTRTHIQAIEFFFFAGLMLLVTIIFAIMSFFYKYVDLSGGNDQPSSRDSAYSSKSHDENSALITSNSRALAEPISDKVQL